MSLDLPVRRPSLVSPVWDFWLLGGLSVVLWAVMAVGSLYRGAYGVTNHFGNLAMTMAALSLFVNYPHFLASYKLAYTRGKSFVTKHWFQTLLVPCLLLDFLIYAYYLANAPDGKERAEWILGMGVNVMYFTVGWHYTKQAFGCMMVYASYDRYPLSRLQRELIRWSLLSVWWYNWTEANQYQTNKFWELTYTTWKLPYWAHSVSFAIFVALGLSVLLLVVARNWKSGKRPSLTFAVPYVAMLLWFAPCFRQYDYYVYVVPFFHSLQYLAFVYRIEQSENPSPTRTVLLTFGLCLTGWLAFEAIPGNLDMVFDNARTFGMSFFLIAANLFLNIHHYFLDNVLWRVRDDPKVRAALFPKP